MKHQNNIWWALCLLLVACQSTTDDSAPVPTPAPEVITPIYLKDSTLIASMSTSDLREEIDPLLVLAGFVQHPIKVYKIEYETKDEYGNAILASGALSYPAVLQAATLLHYTHGTINEGDNEPVPSTFPIKSEGLVSALGASYGFVVIAPDYLGYGSSKTHPHPYEHAATLGSASEDMLKASIEFLKLKGIKFKNELVVVGYSQGGVAGMSLLKRLENDPSHGLEVMQAYLGAGAYHKSAFAKWISMQTVELPFINSYAWVLQTYDRVYGLHRPYSYYYNAPYDSLLEANIYAKVALKPQELFRKQFLESLQTGSDTVLYHIFGQNDLHNWASRSKIRLIHSKEDDYVPYFNSEDAYEYMKSAGNDQMELVEVSGTHAGAAQGYFTNVFSHINRYK